MEEHRLIEYMLEIMVKENSRIKLNNKVEPTMIDTIVDFIRTYADRTHHGKEEDILFAELAKKELEEHDKKLMQELIDEHIYARGKVKALVQAKEEYAGGDIGKTKEISDGLEALANFYPAHIKKEDENFFLRTEKYFSQEELSAMTKNFNEFDRQMIHKKYRQVCEELSQKYQ
jgi:hemerythrin-like domain-containing protein